MNFFLVFLATYLVGSIPFSVIFARLRGVDLARSGTKNLGATNVGVTTGVGWGVLAMLLDTLKGFIPVLLVKVHFGNELIIILTALAAVLGHDFSIFLKFKGGKGVATSGGGFIAIEPIVPAICFLLYAILLPITKHYILTTVIIFTGLPLMVWVFSAGQYYLMLSIVLSLLIYFTHRKDIQQLVQTYAGKKNI
ncbi:glycerol-3-phosphate 1-O-acyltransferase PlsY [Candidatus Margulisiibacteriota bacterium]